MALLDDNSHSVGDEVPACSDADLTSTEVKASTAGDTIVVKGNVSEMSAPRLRGIVIHYDGERKEDSITRRFKETGPFTFRFRYGHHGIDEYDFWLEDCRTTESTDEIY